MAGKRELDTLFIENADMPMFMRNFKGEQRRYNAEGQRNFCLFIDDELAERLLEEGWNVKRLKPREDMDEGDTPQAYLQVKVNFGGRPPRIVMISSSGKTVVTEDSVAVLDRAELKNVDVLINPYVWEVEEKTGVKAYLKTLYVTLVEDELERKYANWDGDEDE